MLTALVVLALLAVLAVGLGLADRALATRAERAASAYLAGPFGRPPTVRVHGRPFLTQALRGRYRDLRVSGSGLRVGDISNARLDARLRNLWLPPRALLARRAVELPCEQVSGQLLVPYAELARRSRVPGLGLAFERGRLLATAALPIPGVSQLVRVSGRARLTVDGDAVWLRVGGLAVAGMNVTALVLRQLLPRMNVAIPLPTLPWGLRVDELQPTADGLMVHVSAAAVVFGAVARPPTADPNNRDGDPAS